MAQKFGRTYSLDILLASGITINITNPFTLQLNVKRALMSTTSGTASFTIINLKEAARHQIFHDRYDFQTNNRVQLYAGYQGQNSLIFVGTIRQAYSFRRGCDWITQIEAWDGGYDLSNAFTSTTLSKTIPLSQAIKRIAQDFINTDTGTISTSLDDFAVLKRGQTLFGRTWDVITNLNPNGVNFIHNEKLHCMTLGEYIPSGQVPILSAATGLLETPEKEKATIRVKSLFEPRAVIGAVVEIQSEDSMFNGQFQVIGISHDGVISDAVGDSCITTLDLWIGTQNLKEATVS